MLEQHARVVQSSPQGVWVEAIEPQGCGVCAGQGCASRRIAELFQRSPRHYQVESGLSLSVGERVIVGVPEGSVLRSAFYLYGLPLLLIMGGALFAQLGFAGDVAAVAGAITGALLAGGIIRFMPSARRTCARPVVIRREEIRVINQE